MAITDPYAPDVVTRLLEPVVQTVHAVTAYRPAFGVELGHRLHLTSGTVSIDEDRAPRFVLDATVGLPDQALLDYLDPRTGTRVLVEVGYEYAGRVLDQHALCDLGLRERVVRRPQNDVTLRAGSDEFYVMDYTLAAPLTFSASTPVRVALLAILTAHDATAPVLITARRAGAGLGESLTVEPGREWEAVRDLADRIDAVVYHDGLTRFVVEDQVLTVGAAAARIETGSVGTLTGTEVMLDRTDFANFVMVVYRWRDSTGAEQVRRGYAQVTNGPYGTDTIGRVGRVVVRERAGSVAEAQTEAASLLPRTVSRGRRVHVEAARALYWLRPAHTVVMRFPLGTDERALVTRLTFDLPTGTMSVHTRQPETITITTGA